MMNPPMLRRKKRPGRTKRHFTTVAVLSVIALTLLVVGSGAATRRQQHYKVWINGKERYVPAFSVIFEILSENPSDWPETVLTDIEGHAIAKTLVTPTITVNGNHATLQTPLPPYARVEITSVASIGEEFDLITGSITSDTPPLIWHRLWSEAIPGYGRFIVGAVSKKKILSDVLIPPVPAVSLAESATAALTFDDGPDPTWTPIVLDILRTKDVRATFFVVGERAHRHPELIKQLISEGHSVQNHTWSHPHRFDALSLESMLDEMTRTSDEIEAATGIRPKYFRPPGGRVGSDVEFAASSLGMRIVMWNVDPWDWAGTTSDEIYLRVTQGIGGGDLILLHDGGGDRGQTTAALPGIIDYLRSLGMSFKTLS